MKATTEQLVSALRVLSVEIHSEDGVANAVIAEAADRMTLLANLVVQHVQETKEDVEQMAVASETMVEATAKIQSLRARIKRLEEAGDKMDETAEPFVLDTIDEDIQMSDVGEQYEIAYDSPPTAGDHVAMDRARKEWRKVKEDKP